MRLIDADKLIKELHDWADMEEQLGDPTDAVQVIEECIKATEEQPTAYDVDKIIEELEELQSEHDPKAHDDPADIGAYWAYVNAKNVVRGEQE